MRKIEFIHQALNADGFFHGVEIFALNVFYQRHCQSRVIRHFTDHHRHFGQASDTRGTPASFTGDDFIAQIGFAGAT